MSPSAAKKHHQQISAREESDVSKTDISSRARDQGGIRFRVTSHEKANSLLEGTGPLRCSCPLHTGVAALDPRLLRHSDNEFGYDSSSTVTSKL